MSNVVSVRFVDGPWSGKLMEWDVDQSPTVTVPQVRRVVGWRWDEVHGVKTHERDDVIYGTVEVPGFGWYAMPGAYPIIGQTFAKAAITEAQLSSMPEDQVRRDLDNELDNQLAKMGHREIPGTARYSRDDETFFDQRMTVFTGIVWGYK